MSPSTTRNGLTDAERPQSHHAHANGTEHRQTRYFLGAASTLLLMVANAAAQQAAVPLGTTSTYGALAGDTITNPTFALGGFRGS